MGMEIFWNTTHARDWQRMTHGAGVAMQQDWAYGAACAALGSPILRAEIRDGGQTIALAQFVQRSFLGVFHGAVCTRGPVWLGAMPPEAKRDVMSLLRRTIPLPRLRGVFFTPDDSSAQSWLGEAGLSCVMTPYSTGMLDLDSPVAGLRRALHGKWRNRLVAAEKAGLTLARCDKTPDRYQWLLDSETRQQAHRRYAALPASLVPAWQEAGGANSLRILTATRGGETLAAMAFLIHGGRATYHIGWASEQGKERSAHNLILWSALSRLRRLGVHRLDLGGLNTDDAPGIARFKLGTGAAVKTLSGTWFGR